MRIASFLNRLYIFLNFLNSFHAAAFQNNSNFVEFEEQFLNSPNKI